MRSEDAPRTGYTFTGSLPRGGTTGVFRLVVLELPAEPTTLEVIVEHRDSDAAWAPWSPAGSISLPDPIVAGRYASEVTGLKRFVRLRLGATRSVRVRLEPPSFTSAEPIECRRAEP